jgi:hypothetical protein
MAQLLCTKFLVVFCTHNTPRNEDDWNSYFNTNIVILEVCMFVMEESSYYLNIILTFSDMF